jgi:orotidine-5'-phosphate decarboxylase
VIPKLAIAVDATGESDFWSQVDRFAGLPVVVKVGLSNLGWFGPAGCERLLKSGFEIFIDAKLHDIPSQVRKAVEWWSSQGCHYLTLHLSGGPSMISEAVSVNSKTQLLGVSVLTSISETEWADWMKTPLSRAQFVVHWIESAKRLGLSGFVCSAGDLRSFDRDFVRSHFFCTPGLNWPGEASSSDQKNSSSWVDAVQEGSKLLVMGRSLLQSTDPRGRASQVLSRLKNLEAM